MSLPIGDGIEFLRDMDASLRWHDGELSGPRCDHGFDGAHPSGNRRQVRHGEIFERDAQRGGEAVDFGIGGEVHLRLQP